MPCDVFFGAISKSSVEFSVAAVVAMARSPGKNATTNTGGSALGRANPALPCLCYISVGTGGRAIARRCKSTGKNSVATTTAGNPDHLSAPQTLHSGDRPTQSRHASDPHSGSSESSGVAPGCESELPSSRFSAHCRAFRRFPGVCTIPLGWRRRDDEC